VATAIQDSFLLKCEGSLTLANSAATREHLLQALDRNQNVFIDTADASEIDITFVQLLVSARKSATALGKQVYLSAPNDSDGIAVLARANVMADDVPARKDAPAPANASPAEISKIEDVDPTALITLINEIGEVAVGQSLSVFFTQMAARIETLRGLSEDAKLAEIRRELHPLKGAAGTFGLKGISAEVVDLERKVGTLGAGGYGAALDRLTSALENARAILRSVLAKASS
jgi:anti-anti-sigma regulatory factor/HPt (histidine-containing phosphotransfer) domain-containing protein